MLTICWLTSRREGCWNWFNQSLRREVATDPEGWDGIRVVKVDFHAPKVTRYKRLTETPPKPTVWQGKYKLTKHDYFCASNARNTGICFAPDGWIAYVDDLSILMPGWLASVREAMKHNYIVCGAFRKVLKLNMTMPGADAKYEDHPNGKDSRWKDTGRVLRDCPPNWLFGCSMAAPINAFLRINGWPELCDSTGVGCEDCLTGHALAASGHHLKYDQRMFTLESEERHHKEKAMLRMDKGKIGTPDSKSHALVRLLGNVDRFENDFGPFPDLAALRQHILSGGDFPVIGRPTHDWYDGVPLREL